MARALAETENRVGPVDILVNSAAIGGVNTIVAQYPLDEWRADAASGRLREAFACGTAAVITSIGRVAWPDGEFTMPDNTELTRRLRGQLLDIQRGRAADRYGWVRRVAVRSTIPRVARWPSSTSSAIGETSSSDASWSTPVPFPSSRSGNPRVTATRKLIGVARPAI